MCELLAQPERYDGRTVLVNAVILFGDAGGIGDPERCARWESVCLLPGRMEPSVAQTTLVTKDMTMSGFEVTIGGTFHRRAPCQFNPTQPALSIDTYVTVRELPFAEQPSQ